MAKKTQSQVAKAMEVPEYKPCIEIDEKMYPGVKDLKIDQDITLTLKVKIKSIRRDRWDGNKLSVSGEIQNAAPEKEDDIDEDD